MATGSGGEMPAESVNNNNMNINDEAAKAAEENENKCLRYIEGSFRLLEQARAAALSNSRPNCRPNTQLNNLNNTTTTTSSSTNHTGGTVSSDSVDSMMSSTTMNTAGSMNSWQEAATKDFRQSFPGLSSRTSGRSLQTHLRPSLSTARRNSAPSPYSRPPLSSRSSSFNTNATKKPWSGKILNTWTHDFVCLSRLDSKYTPVISLMDMLRRAGLGKKKIVFTNKYGDHEHLKQTLEDCFPR